MKILILGNTELSEFRFVLDRMPADIVRKYYPLQLPWEDFPEWTPTLLLLLQSFPGEFSYAEIASLKARFPISPIVVIQGTWCEGCRRTDPPPKGIHYLYWHEFHALFPAEYAAWKKGLGMVWSQPEMGGHDLWYLNDSQRSIEIPAENPAPITIRIFTEDHAFYALLRDAFLRDVFWREAVNILPFSTVETSYDALLFDFPDFQPATRRQFSELLSHSVPQKTCIFSEFPRVEEWVWLENLGIQGLFSKPFRIRDLLRQSYQHFPLAKTTS